MEIYISGIVYYFIIHAVCFRRLQMRLKFWSDSQSAIVNTMLFNKSFDEKYMSKSDRVS